MIENTVVFEEYLKQAAKALFKERILSALSSYQDLIRAANKTLTKARGKDIVDIMVLLEVNYPTFKACWYATRDRVNQMTNKWWFFQGRLQARLNEILWQYANPLVVAQVIENAKLRQALDEAKKEIVELKGLTQLLKRQWTSSRVAASQPVPIPAAIPRSHSSHNLGEDLDDGAEVEMASVSTKAQSCPDYKKMGMFAGSK